MEFEILAPAIFMYEFPFDLAKDLIDSFNDYVEWQHSSVGIQADKDQDIRTSESFPFELEMPFASEKVKKIMIDCVNHYMHHHNINVTQDEGLDLLKYEVSNKYDYHSDSNWMMYRTVSMLIYLNPSEYEGGETHFKHFDVNVKPDGPAIVVFPSNYAYEHSAKPVTKGVKYVFVTWGNDLPNRFSPNIMANVAASVGVL